MFSVLGEKNHPKDREGVGTPSYKTKIFNFLSFKRPEVRNYFLNTEFFLTLKNRRKYSITNDLGSGPKGENVAFVSRDKTVQLDD